MGEKKAKKPSGSLFTGQTGEMAGTPWYDHWRSIEKPGEFTDDRGYKHQTIIGKEDGETVLGIKTS